MEKSFDVNQMPQLARDFASYKLTIQVCSKKTVDEYLSDLRLFFKYVYAKRNGINPLGDSFNEIDISDLSNDFIFSIVCEELGFVGATLIVVLFALLVWRGFTIGMKAPDKFGSMLTIGLTAQIGVQVALNMAVVTNIMPNTGISLPFFSYGGTSLVMLLAQMGVVLSVSRSVKAEKR